MGAKLGAILGVAQSRVLSVGSVLSVLALLTLTACGFVGGGGGPVFQLETVQVRASGDANGYSATAVDMVFVYDPSVIDVLQAVPASDWFNRKRQFLLDYPKGISVMSWEIVPSSVLTPWTVPDDMLSNDAGDDATAAFVFADYLSPGAHRARLESGVGIRIDLARDDFTLSPFNTDN
jgi:type VI secretion system protein